jgi:site-specific recombinase XerD
VKRSYARSPLQGAQLPVSNHSVTPACNAGWCIDEFLADYAAGPTSTHIYWSSYVGRAFREHLAHLGVSDIHDVTTSLVRDYVARLASPDRLPRKLSPKSVHHHYLGARRFLEWCVEQGHLATNPAALVRPPSVPTSIRTGYSQEEVSRMLAATGTSSKHGQHWLSLRDRAIIVFLLDTGARADELCRISREELDLERRTVILHGKNQRDRMMPLGETNVRQLRAYLRARPMVPGVDEVWLTIFGEPLRYRALREIFRRLERYTAELRRPVPHIECHRFRHTFAAAHYERNRDLVALQGALDHQQVTTTMGYLRGLGVSFQMKARYATPADWLVRNVQGLPAKSTLKKERADG